MSPICRNSSKIGFLKNGACIGIYSVFKVCACRGGGVTIHIYIYFNYSLNMQIQPQDLLCSGRFQGMRAVPPQANSGHGKGMVTLFSSHHPYLVMYLHCFSRKRLTGWGSSDVLPFAAQNSSTGEGKRIVLSVVS